MTRWAVSWSTSPGHGDDVLGNEVLAVEGLAGKAGQLEISLGSASYEAYGAGRWDL
jgi:hypothetical protein